MNLPPGIVYLSRSLPVVLVPPAFVWGAALVAREHLEIALPTWLFLLSALFSPAVGLALYILVRDYKYKKDADALGAAIPPAVEAKWIGSIDLYKIMDNDFLTRFTGNRLFEWAEQYGYIFNFRLLFENRIFTAEPEYIKAVLATEFAAFEKGPKFHFQMDTLLGTGVFNSDGEMWKFHRAMTRPFFSKDRISHFDIFERHAEDALEQLKTRMKEGYAVDWQDLVSRFTLDSATEFLFGRDVRSLSAGLPYPPGTPQALADHSAAHPSNQFAEAFLEAQLASSKRSRFTNAWPLFEFWHNKVSGPMKVIDGFIDPLIKNALEQKVQRSGTGEKKEKDVADDDNLLGHLVNLTDDTKILKDETLNILLAGRDTTAATLTFAVYQLAENPYILRRLREEILEKVGSTRRPTYDDIRDMKYLRAFINETLRLYPPVPFNVRYNVKPVVWSSRTPGEKPHYIPAGTKIMYSVFMMHRRKDLWGPDALEFDPDRFLDSRLSRYLTPNPFIFLPFNAGPRICLGQQFAYNETSFMLIRLLQQFSSFTLVQESNPAAVPPPGWAKSKGSNGRDKVWMRTHLTLYVKDGLWMKMEEAPATESV